MTKNVRAISAAALALGTLTQFSFLPVSAQSTMLMGSVKQSTQVQPQAVKLVPMQAVYDVRPVSAVRPRVYKGATGQTRYVYVKDNRSYWQRHPKVKAVAIGAGVGTAAGAVTGMIAGKGVLRGAAIGAGTGAGVGLVRSSRTMKRHPIIMDTATGTLAGLGLGAAASRRGKRIGQATGVGAAVGLAAGLLRNGLH